MAAQRKMLALLIGINYTATPECALQGCVNDVVDMAAYLSSAGFTEIKMLTDAKNANDAIPVPSRSSITSHLAALAQRTQRESIDAVWIHYSGHGSYVLDENRDEADGRDECLVPSDYATAGLIADDELRLLLAAFNRKTRVVFVSDACHSATVGDLPILWDVDKRSPMSATSSKAMQANVVMISGCRDDQTSADAYNAAQRRYQGALTAALLDSLRALPALRSNVFRLLSEVRRVLRRQGHTQIPQLTSTQDLRQDCTILPKDQPPKLLRSLPISAIYRPPSRASFMPQWKIAVAHACFSARMPVP